MRLTEIISNRKRFRDIPFLMVFPDGATTGGEEVDLEEFKQEYAPEIKQADSTGKIWCIVASNPQGPKPTEL